MAARTRSRSQRKTLEAKSKKDELENVVHFDWHEGMVLNARFTLQRLLGDGSFGRVVLAADQTADRQVAVKIIRDVEKYRKDAMVEAEILRDIHKADTYLSSACVVMYDTFTHDDRFFCLVFEPMGVSLYDILAWNEFRGYWVKDIQAFASQSLHALKFLHDRLHLTHTDLKLENVLLASSEAAVASFFPRGAFQASSHVEGSTYVRPFTNEIKLIDFGNATYRHMHHSSVISTRQYRAPEVILQLGWDESADIWSLGCILIELYTGRLLFETHESLEHLALMETILQPLPTHMLSNASRRAKKQFLAAGSADDSWRLRWPEGASSVTSVSHVARQWHLTQLAPLDHQYLVQLVGSLLTADHTERPSATKALEHPFFLVSFDD